MRGLRSIGTALALILVLAMSAAAQEYARMDGQVLDKEGKPYPDITVKITNPDSGQSFTTKTDKNGKFVQLGLRNAVYAVTVSGMKDIPDYTVKTQVGEQKENNVIINFKEIFAETAASHPEEAKKKEEEENKFKAMKEHFEAGMASMNDISQLRTQLKAAPPDQRGPIQDKLTADYQTAINELQQADAAAGPKEVKNHATILGNLGQAYSYAGRYDDAVTAFQKAIDLQPQPAFYLNLGTNLAYAGVADSDKKAGDAKIAAASDACSRADSLNPTAPTDSCWKNLGIVLSNKGRMKDAAPALQKATQIDPKDADAWFLLGGALSGSIESKQQGTEITYVVPPGTTEAYKKYLELAPTGPHAAESKAMLDALATYQGGEQTTVLKKKKN